MANTMVTLVGGLNAGNLRVKTPKAEEIEDDLGHPGLRILLISGVHDYQNVTFQIWGSDELSLTPGLFEKFRTRVKSVADTYNLSHICEHHHDVMHKNSKQPEDSFYLRYSNFSGFSGAQTVKWVLNKLRNF